MNYIQPPVAPPVAPPIIPAPHAASITALCVPYAGSNMNGITQQTAEKIKLLEAVELESYKKRKEIELDLYQKQLEIDRAHLTALRKADLDYLDQCRDREIAYLERLNQISETHSRAHLNKIGHIS